MLMAESSSSGSRISFTCKLLSTTVRSVWYVSTTCWVCTNDLVMLCSTKQCVAAYIKAWCLGHWQAPRARVWQGNVPLLRNCLVPAPPSCQYHSYAPPPPVSPPWSGGHHGYPLEPSYTHEHERMAVLYSQSYHVSAMSAILGCWASFCCTIGDIVRWQCGHLLPCVA